MCTCTQREGNRCVGNNSIRALNINSWADLAALELRGNGGCGGGGVNDQDGNFYDVGGEGGAGGGGLWISAHGYNITDLDINTSGADGQPGQVATVNGFSGERDACGGAGAGGNSGRIVLVYDGGVGQLQSVSNPAQFIRSQRGMSPAKSGGCTGKRGDNNSNRDERPIQIAPLNCK